MNDYFIVLTLFFAAKLSVGHLDTVPSLCFESMKVQNVTDCHETFGASAFGVTQVNNQSNSIDKYELVAILNATYQELKEKHDKVTALYNLKVQIAPLTNCSRANADLPYVNQSIHRILLSSYHVL